MGWDGFRYPPFKNKEHEHFYFLDLLDPASILEVSDMARLIPEYAMFISFLMRLFFIVN